MSDSRASVLDGLLAAFAVCVLAGEFERNEPRQLSAVQYPAHWQREEKGAALEHMTVDRDAALDARDTRGEPDDQMARQRCAGPPHPRLRDRLQGSDVIQRQDSPSQRAGFVCFAGPGGKQVHQEGGASNDCQGEDERQPFRREEQDEWRREGHRVANRYDGMNGSGDAVREAGRAECWNAPLLAEPLGPEHDRHTGRQDDDSDRARGRHGARNDAGVEARR